MTLVKLRQLLVKGKGVVARIRLKEAGGQSDEPEPVLSGAKGTETPYKAKPVGKSATNDKVQ